MKFVSSVLIAFLALFIFRNYAKATPDDSERGEGPTVGEAMEALSQNGLLRQQQILERLLERIGERQDEHSRYIRDLTGNNLATVLSFQGDYLSSIRVFPVSYSQNSNLEVVYPATGRLKLKKADVSISKLARDKKILIINEAHHVPETRWLPISILPALKESGYHYLALEALSENGASVGERGYANFDTGSYTNEPIYSELIRRALALGFTLIRYDTAVDAGQEERESTQAKNILKILKDDPLAKVLIVAGYRHAAKNDQGAGGGGTLATRLSAVTKNRVVTIDQTSMVSNSGRAREIAESLLKKFKPSEPSVLVNENGAPWSLQERQFDATVLLPSNVEVFGRPNWLSLGGMRMPVEISAAICNLTFPCLIEARPLRESSSSVPSDRFVLRSASDRSKLYLPTGKYILLATDIDGRLLHENEIGVRPSAISEYKTR
ncbi:hypothetical protein NYQ43_19070 [Xanthomonas translucens pv. translucens]|uniref:Secreted protein n=1 Tax=Xanthomonas translucens pv. translucens DSM 18974 TaxID=1261556 RepID=A0A1C3TS79_XANCT|nr:hypothetical protein [Xanthomonas translucens]MCT8287725.1 hypothetical protein [Xanthomonas translucens pv. translucens]MCT8305383.1 hypothetical protein [Xanthomonas translucens pv. translucens]SCB06089.1 unnamed protein product [Xanthomonas translucens pv. translucens DSM 18974]